ncbi:Plant Tudor-like RNA-binding protein [Euphorbia peplus]|nr:Plant Tudor-like RNA-binding protein [Euphorbia peplus]
MRFKKGTKVEVITRNHGCFGVWRSAEIVSIDGHIFSVVYDYDEDDLVVEVLEKCVRPCPPVLDDCWSPGDLVEVFEGFCWKTAAVLKVFGLDWYVVKLIGCSKEVRVGRFEIRVRQLWQDGQWVVIGKGSRNMEDSRANRLVALSSDPKITTPILHPPAAENCLTVENTTGFQHSCVMTDRTLKRASPFQSSNGKASKVRAMEKKGEPREVMSRCSALFLKKVDAAVYPQQCFGETYMRTSPIVESFHARSSERYESDIDECSVGSCSVISNSPSKVCSPALVGNSCDEDSDAESFYGEEGRRKRHPSVGVNVAVRIHSLELHAYRCTLEALFASGPLNWEQEGMLTNLRMSLNVSNDEHLLELRNLSSSRSSVYVR